MNDDDDRDIHNQQQWDCDDVVLIDAALNGDEDAAEELDRQWKAEAPALMRQAKADPEKILPFDDLIRD